MGAQDRTSASPNRNSVPETLSSAVEEVEPAHLRLEGCRLAARPKCPKKVQAMIDRSRIYFPKCRGVEFPPAPSPPVGLQPHILPEWASEILAPAE